ncbi:SulP family inorganic anion transporter [Nocardioides conyzicola]|uniref:SulP family inorganic anion transporter n=1 Tax=Nocardioides conyzicola TaxID=1651781 RepID=A0ABP8XF53_9ACTN
MPAGLLPTLSGYRRGWIRYDVVAGLAAGTVVIPQAMAYATIAGLPVEVGLYTCMLPMVAYALLGGSRSLSISTTSTIAILTASTLATLPADRSGDDLLRSAFTLTVLVGLALLVMRLFRLGSLVEQISPATMTGVKAGVGLTVAATQLPTLLGVAGDAEDEGFFGKLGDTISKLGDLNTATVAVSAGAIAVLYALRRLAPQVPGPLVVAVGGILLVAATDIESHGLALIPDVPSGLPTPTMPLWGDIGALLPGALAIAVMAFMETVLVARAQRQRSEPAIDSDQELLANGVAALAGGFSQCLPPAGGFSQSAVNQRAGARSQLAGIVTAVLAVLVALFLGPVLDDLPEAILAAMVMVAVLGLVSPAEFARLRRIDRAEFWVALAVAVVGLTAGLLLAVGLGVALTLVLVLRAFSSNRARPLYPRAGGGWTLVAPAPGDVLPAYDDVLLLHLESGLYTGNARPTQDAILAAALAARPRAVVLEGAQVTRVTVPLLEVVQGLAADLQEEGIGLLLAGFPESTVEAARHSHWFARFDEGGRVFRTVDEAVEKVRTTGP